MAAKEIISAGHTIVTTLVIADLFMRSDELFLVMGTVAFMDLSYVFLD
jgi:hypothetical protein